MSRPGWHHRGYLPHCDCDALIQHVVFRLADSLPRSVTESVRFMSQVARRVQLDAALDKGHGEAFLRDPLAGEITSEALRKFDGERYSLHAWCVMPNHVHVVVQPIGQFELGGIVKSWKAFTAAQINRALGRKGALWAPDYFDRFMRTNEHLCTTIAYVERNPVKAGLCSAKSEWPLSSATAMRA